MPLRTDAHAAGIQVAKAVAAHGVNLFFGLMGDGNLVFVDAMTRRHGARFVAAAREDGGVLMAIGHSRVTGGIGVATVTHGPGLTNTATALVEAARSDVPMLLVAADTDPLATAHPQRLDQERFARACGAATVRVRSYGSAYAQTEEAIRLALDRRCPVVLDVPVGSLPDGEQVVAPTRQGSSVRCAAPEADVASVARRVRSADKVVVLAGQGAVDSGARPALVRLADRCGGLLATTLQAKDYFRGHPFDLGLCGGFSDDLVRDELAHADCVLAFGASLNGFTTDGGKLLADAVVVQCDRDPDALGRHRSVHHPLVGDASVVAGQLHEALATDDRTRGRSEELRARLAGAERGDPFDDASDDSGVDLRTVCRWLDREMPEDRLLVVDGGHATLSEPARRISVRQPRDFCFPLGFGSVGLGLGAALGAAAAVEDRPVLAMMGDGGFVMSWNELDTAVREWLPVVVVVLNDRAYGYEYHNMVTAGLPTTLSEFERPSFAAVAEAMGARGATVHRLSDLASAAAVLEGDGPAVIDVHITRQVKTTWFARHEG